MRLKEIGYRYGSQVALKKINLELKKGEFVSIMGDNGSGKSTLLRILSGLLTPSTGEFYFNGQIINKRYFSQSQRQKKFHQQVGYLFQNSDVQLFNPTVREEIQYGPRQLGLTNNEIEQRTVDCLALFEISNLADRYPINLSGGEKKLVSFAATLALNPSYLLLDEPFNGLTRKNRQLVQNILLQLQLAGKTIIMVSHHYQQVAPLTQKLVLMNGQHSLSYVGSLLSEKEIETLIE